MYASAGVCIDKKCTCARGWNGTTCSTCSGGYYGPTCAPCPSCGRGWCGDGLAGKGKCHCPPGILGPDCSTCDVGFVGPYCQLCPACDTVTVAAKCQWSPKDNATHCNCSSLAYDPASNCTQCARGTFGSNCSWAVTYVIAFSTLGGGAAAVAIVVVVWWCRRRQRRKK